MKINYLAVVVCAVAYWVLGGVWYGVLFGMRWMALENMTAAQNKNMNSPATYIATFLLNLVIAYVLAQLCSWSNANTVVRGAAMGLLIWIGIVAPIAYTNYMYEMRSKELFAINEFYPLLGLCLMGAILGAWKKRAT